ncbi:polysialyltransferase family glycosyltransferase [Streptomyces sp. NPDC049916]|uniref:polysialyltransferase family glycosyltransferase n=1 Tax=Streptomyces sp. NPDC049916 TaxID=3155156 RepID=UPI00342862F5
MTTRIFHASSPAAVILLAAAIDAGCFTEPDRRILLLSRTGPAPETVPAVSETAGFDRLRTRFDEVVSWNATIDPFHPDGWLPRPDDVPLWERHFRRAWGLGGSAVELVVDSPHTGPARALAQVFTGVPVDVYAEGPGGYGPTGDKVPPLTGTRVRRLLHPDLVPGVRPLLLAEYGAEPQTVPTEAQMKVIAELSDAGSDLPDFGDAPVLLLGQDLAASGVLPAAEEAELERDMVRGAAALGHTRLVFAPGPYGRLEDPAGLRAEAERAGVELTVLSGPASPVADDVLLHRLRPALVVGCSSGALLRAARLHGLPVAAAGTGLLLERLAPYENPERTAVTLADALLPDLADAEAVTAQRPRSEAELDGLLTAVAFAMRPRVRPDLRAAAERYLTGRLDAHTWRYFKRRRLASLALPGAVPARLAFLRRNATLRRVARRARQLKRGRR